MSDFPDLSLERETWHDFSPGRERKIKGEWMTTSVWDVIKAALTRVTGLASYDCYNVIACFVLAFA